MMAHQQESRVERRIQSEHTPVSVAVVIMLTTVFAPIPAPKQPDVTKTELRRGNSVCVNNSA